MFVKISREYRKKEPPGGGLLAVVELFSGVLPGLVDVVGEVFDVDEPGAFLGFANPKCGERQVGRSGLALGSGRFQPQVFFCDGREGNRGGFILGHQ